MNNSDPMGMAERITEDFRWKMNCFFHGGNSFDGSWGEFNGRQANPAFTGVVRWEKPAGNWDEPDPKHHEAANGSLAGGVDAAETSMSKPKATANADGSVIINSRLDWFTEEQYLLTRVSLAEINDHIAGWRRWQNDLWGDQATKTFKPDGRTAKEVAGAFERKYGIEWNAQKGAQLIFDNPLTGTHSISRNPDLKKPVTAAEIEQAVRDLP